jgi:hypothetical protein
MIGSPENREASGTDERKNHSTRRTGFPPRGTTRISSPRRRAYPKGPSSDICQHTRTLPAERVQPTKGVVITNHGASFSDRYSIVQNKTLTIELARRARLAAHGPRHGRSLLRILPADPEADHARHQRHIRCGSWRPAIAALQCALRRIWFSVDRRIRRRRPLHHDGASPRQTARRQGDPRLPTARHMKLNQRGSVSRQN